MRRKLGLEAFQYYFSLGDGRSYEAVAVHFGVSKTTVVNTAKRENWQTNVESMERAARSALEKRAVDEAVAMKERHAKLARLAAAKGAEHLAQGRIEKTSDALRALKLGMDEERLAVLGPGKRDAVKTNEEAAGKARDLAAQIRAAMLAAAATVPGPPRA
ncbi:MAG: hypothetical protein IT459_13090 [Planctomycetes bacterium]|nr:hypothetical protein [Planctomycetota bacterium]